MPDKALEALKQAYRQHVEWMHSHAEKLETGKCQHLEQEGSTVVNISQQLAADFRHKAGNLEALIVAYERLSSHSGNH